MAATRYFQTVKALGDFTQGCGYLHFKSTLFGECLLIIKNCNVFFPSRNDDSDNLRDVFEEKAAFNKACAIIEEKGMKK